MKQIRTILSVVSILTGVIIISVSKIVEEMIPMLGRVAFQTVTAGSYNPNDYIINLSINYWLGSLCIVVGLVSLLFKGWIDRYIEVVKQSNK